VDLKELEQTVIFRGMSREEIARAAAVMKGHERTYEKDSIVLHAGDTTEEMGIVLEGSVMVENNDVYGNRTILNHVGKGDIFAEVYSLLGNEPMLIDIRANEKSRIFFLRTGDPPQQMIEPWHGRFLRNLLLITSRKNLQLSGRSFHISPKTVRGKIIAYLDTMSLRSHSREFDIPFDRQQLADYLNVERTALSKELGRMKQDGLIDFRRSHFRILSGGEE